MQTFPEDLSNSKLENHQTAILLSFLHAGLTSHQSQILQFDGETLDVFSNKMVINWKQSNSKATLKICTKYYRIAFCFTYFEAFILNQGENKLDS